MSVVMDGGDDDDGEYAHKRNVRLKKVFIFGGNNYKS